jgi:Phospholipase_D-nuclease N-terminal/Short C-terminal domain
MMNAGRARARLKSPKQGGTLIVADYPFLEVLGSMLIFFAWVWWFWLLISIAGDVFRRRDIGGGGKTLWLLFMLFVPFLGVFVYLLTQHDGMAERTLDRARAQQAGMDEYVRSVAGSGGGAAAEIDRAKNLLDSGAIDRAEFETLKAKALAT